MDKFSHRDRRAEQRRPGDRVLPARRVAGLPADRNAVSLSLGGVGGSGGGEGQRPGSAEPLLLSSAFHFLPTPSREGEGFHLEMWRWEEARPSQSALGF